MSRSSDPNVAAEDRSEGPGPTTRALDVQSLGRAGLLASWAVALLAGGGAYVLLRAGGRTALTGGVLLGTVALAALAVAVQATGEPWPGEPGYAEEYGPSDDGAPAPEARARPLPLADRIALGLLGGAAGGLAVTVAVWLADGAGLLDLLGVRVAGGVTGAALSLRAWYGALWGLVLAVLYPRLPGRSALSRCTMFGLAPAVYALLVVYPLVLGLGWLAAELGALAFLFVILFHLLWGAVAGGFFRWGETSDLGVLSRPLVGGGSGR